MADCGSGTVAERKSDSPTQVSGEVCKSEDGNRRDIVEIDSTQSSLSPTHGQSGNRSPADKADQSGDAVNGCKRKRHRRGKNKGGKHHRRKWKPYNKLTWEERKVLDEKETKRACLKREERFASGHPVAPYNTTQFLMEDREQASPAFDVRHKSRSTRGGDGSGSLDSSDDYYDSPNDEEIFLEKEFAETYENFHAERLQTMTKDELVREHIMLESKVESLEKKVQNLLAQQGSRVNGSGIDALSLEGCQNKGAARSLQAEIERLRAENQRLRRENEQLESGKKGSE